MIPTAPWDDPYWVYDEKGTKIGKIPWDSWPAPPWDELYQIPGLGPRLKMADPLYLDFDYENGYVEIAGTLVAILSRIDTDTIDTPKPQGNCPRCNAPGQFVKTALMCPICKDFLGGF